MKGPALVTGERLHATKAPTEGGLRMLCARYAEAVQRYGYVQGGMDWWEDTFVLAPQFEMAEDFAEDLGCVRLDGKYGFIDATGQWVIPPQFDRAHSFSW